MHRLMAQSLASIALCVSLAHKVEAATIVSNLGNATTFSIAIRDDLLVAQSFTTDSTSYTLDSITVRARGSNGSSEIQFALYDDTTNHPGTLINAFTGPGTPLVDAEYSYLPSAAVTLGASTKYWVVASVLPGEGDYLWVMTADLSELGPGTLGGYVGSGTQGATWGTESPEDALLLKVTGTAVPEPTSLALAAAGFLGLATLVWARRKRKT